MFQSLKQLFSVVSIFASLIVAQTSVVWFPYLGSADPTTPSLSTPRYGIHYNIHNLAKSRKHIEVKTPAYIRQNNPTQADALIADFQNYAAIVQDPNAVGQRIDQEYTRVANKWLACGGQYAQVVNAMNTKAMGVDLESIPFMVNGYYAAGAMFKNDAGYAWHIRSVGYSITNLVTNPWTRHFDDIVGWEIGNAFQVSAGWFTNVSSEIGDNSPCGK